MYDCIPYMRNSLLPRKLEKKHCWRDTFQDRTFTPLCRCCRLSWELQTPSPRPPQGAARQHPASSAAQPCDGSTDRCWSWSRAGIAHRSQFCSCKQLHVRQRQSRRIDLLSRVKRMGWGETSGMGQGLLPCPCLSAPVGSTLLWGCSHCSSPAASPQPAEPLCHNLFGGPWLVSPCHHLAGVRNGVSPARCLHRAPQGTEALWWDGRLVLLLEGLVVEAGAGRGGSTGCMWAVSCQRDQQAFGSGWHSAG